MNDFLKAVHEFDVANPGTHLPVVEGGPPELASVAEGVRGHPADHERLTALAQLKEALVRPHVRTLPAHIDGDVSHNLHPLGVRIGLQVPLLPKSCLKARLTPQAVCT